MIAPLPTGPEALPSFAGNGQAGGPPRVLVLSAAVGTGHVRAAEAVEAALRQLHPEARGQGIMRRRSALWQLFLLRLRDFFREPTTILWVYGFPLFLAITLGVAFSAGGPDAPMAPGEAPIAVRQDRAPAEAAALGRRLEAAGLTVRPVRGDEGRQLLRAGAASQVVSPGPTGYAYAYDPDRPDSLLARYKVDDLV
jgi:hypothetical protein